MFFFFFEKWLTPGGKGSIKDSAATYRSARVAHPTFSAKGQQRGCQSLQRAQEKLSLGPEEMLGEWLAHSPQKRWRMRPRLICVSVSAVFSDAGAPTCMCVSECVYVYMCM